VDATRTLDRVIQGIREALRSREHMISIGLPPGEVMEVLRA
jgi:hypothetical protein